MRLLMVRSRRGVSNLANTAISIVLAGNAPATSRLSEKETDDEGIPMHPGRADQGNTILDGSMVGGGASASVDSHGHGELRNRWSSASS